MEVSDSDYSAITADLLLAMPRSRVFRLLLRVGGPRHLSGRLGVGIQLH
jgi:hypothetical protein